MPCLWGSEGRPKDVRRHAVVPSIIMLLSAALLGTGLVAMQGNAHDALVADFEARRDQFLESLRLELSDFYSTVETAAFTVESMERRRRSLPPTTAEERALALHGEMVEFLRLSNRWIEQRAGYTGYSWNPVVLNGTGREQLEQARRVVTNSTLPIRDFDGSAGPAPFRPAYMPVVLHSTLTSAIILRDRYTHGPSKPSLTAMLEGSGTAYTDPSPKPLNEAERATAILVYRPVYDCDMLTLPPRIEPGADGFRLGTKCPVPATQADREGKLLGAVICASNLAAVAEVVQQRLMQRSEMRYSVLLGGVEVWATSDEDSVSGVPAPKADTDVVSTSSVDIGGFVSIQVVASPRSKLLDQYPGIPPSGWYGISLLTVSSIAVSLMVFTYAVRLENAASRRERAQAEAKRETLLLFLKSTSHDMRTPLQSISSACELLTEDFFGALRRAREAGTSVHLPKRQQASWRKLLGTILSSSSALLLITENVMDLQRLADGSSRVVAAAADVRALLLRVVRIMQGSPLLSRSVKLRCSNTASLPTVRLDHEKITRVVLNLVTNALKFTKSGQVDVVARLATEEEWRAYTGAHCPPGACIMFASASEAHVFIGNAVSLSGVAAGDTAASSSSEGVPAEGATGATPSHAALLLSVRDTGRGMTREQATLCANTYERSSQEDGGGFGLGLHVVRDSVAAMGGALHVHSMPGRGSNFFFVLVPELAAAEKPPDELDATMVGLEGADEDDATLGEGTGAAAGAMESSSVIPAMASELLFARGSDAQSDAGDSSDGSGAHTLSTGTLSTGRVAPRTAASPPPTSGASLQRKQRVRSERPGGAPAAKPATRHVSDRPRRSRTSAPPAGLPSPRFDSLPLGDVAEAGTAQGAQAPSDRRLVLVVDDTPSTLDLLRMQLTRMGLNALTAHSGEQALDLARRNTDHLHAVILDLQLPGISGLETAVKLRGEGHVRSSCKLIALTGDVIAASTLNLSCFDAVVTKPCHRHVLERKILGEEMNYT